MNMNSYTLPILFRRCVQCIWSLVLFFLLVSSALAAPKGNAVPVQDILLVWSADHGEGEQIFFSHHKEDGWTVPVQISSGKNFSFKPAAAVGDDGTIWVVWTESGKKGSVLQFTVYRNRRWAAPRQIKTGLKDNRAVTIAVDRNNIPWIAWTGTKKSYSDVFWSRWNGTGWATPVMAHAENEVPDVQPELALDESGQPVLSWQTYAGGRYGIRMQRWNGLRWQVLQPGSEKKSVQKRIVMQKELPPLPEYIKEPYKATLFVRTREGSWSVPLSRL